MPADLEFEAEWILSVHRVGVVPKEDPFPSAAISPWGGHTLARPSKLSRLCLCLGQRCVLGYLGSLPDSLSGNVAHRMKGSNGD